MTVTRGGVRTVDVPERGAVFALVPECELLDECPPPDEACPPPPPPLVTKDAVSACRVPICSAELQLTCVVPGPQAVSVREAEIASIARTAEVFFIGTVYTFS